MALPEMTPFPADKETHVESVGHDGDHLFVKFKNSDDHYRYENCPADHHAGMLAAESPGKYLHQHVKGKFEHTKVAA